MSIKNNFLKWTLLFILTININTMNAQNNINANQSLNPQQKSIVSIAALTAAGDLEHLKTQLNAGLDAGLSINEIKEVVVQLYAYCGFPRSLNGINTFMNVVEVRKAKGIADVEGKDASPITDVANKYETGRKLCKRLQDGKKRVQKPELMHLLQPLILF